MIANQRNTFSIALFHELEINSVKYSVLRNWSLLPEDLGGSDLDICVAHDDSIIFSKILTKVALDTKSSLVSFLHDKHSYKVCYLSEVEGIQIDVFDRGVHYKDATLVTETQIFENTISYNGISVLESAFSNLIAYIKEVVNNKKCSEKCADAIYYRKEVYTAEYLQAKLPLLFNAQRAELFVDAVANRRLVDSAQTLGDNVRKTISAKITIPSKIAKLKRIAYPPGYVMAILGTDGSGKSTIINSLTPWLEGAFHHGVAYMHLRPHWLPDIAELFGKRYPQTDVPQGENATEQSLQPVCPTPHALPPAGIVGSLLRWCYYLGDYSIGYLVRVFASKTFKAKVVLFDRYYYDYYIDPLRSRIRLPHWILRIGELFVPKPDIVLCLGGDPEKIYARKPETSLEEVMRQTEELKHFATERKNAVWIDTTKPIEESVAEAKSAILKMMSTQFKNVL